jgi:hypothetical protein
MAIDGLGTRTNGIDSETGDEVEFLDLSPELVDHPGFVATLGERVARFAAVRHASYVHLRRLDRPNADSLELVSDLTPGWRLSELLNESSANNIPLEITVVIGLLRQLLPAVALYGRHNRDAAIGALAVERLIVTPQARVVIAEHAFGPALEKLNLGRDKLWRELRVAMPPSAGLPRSNQRADANAIGVVALSLLLGRVLGIEEYPAQLQSLVAEVREHRDGEMTTLSTPFANWLGRALQFDVRTAFQAPSEAQLAFEAVLASDRSYVTSSPKLDEWVRRVGAIIDAKRNPPSPEQSDTLASRAPQVADAPPALHAPDAPYAPPAPNAPSAPDAPNAPDAPDAPYAPYAPKKPLSPLFAMGAVILLLIGTVGWMWSRAGDGPRAGEGQLVVQSRPQGARVSVDGTTRGVTPITLNLSSGAHVLEVQVGTAEPRVIPLTIQANVQTAQYIELQDVQSTGVLDIKSQPTGARVLIDGQPRGTTPATIRNLAAGDHTVVLELGGRKVTQAVTIDPGITAQLMVPIPRR